MPKYKVLIPFFKLSDQKSYSVNDEIELSKEQAIPLLGEKRIEAIEKEVKKTDKK